MLRRHPGDRREIYDGETVVVSGTPGEIAVPNAKLWSAETPYLYTCVIRKGSRQRRTRFGIRLLEWNAKKGLRVNGTRVLLLGSCIHLDHGVLGTRDLYDAEYRRISILKANGFNALRIARNPASRITLDICDELGLYVMNETFDSWYVPKTCYDYTRWFYTARGNTGRNPYRKRGLSGNENRFRVFQRHGR